MPRRIQPPDTVLARANAQDAALAILHTLDLDGLGSRAPGPWAECLTVTPAMAARWLGHARRNRASRPRKLTEYTQAMRQGQWDLNGSTILFDTNGALMDGRHRLLACLEAEAAFETFVIFALEPGVMPTVDIGQSRSPGDALSIELGLTNTNRLAAALRWVRAYESGLIRASGSLAPLSRPDMFATLRQHPNIVNCLPVAPQLKGLLPGGLTVAWCYLMERADPDLAQRFWQALAYGEGLSREDAVYVLRERLQRERGRRNWRINVHMAALLVKAWNCWRQGMPQQAHLSWRPDAHHPEPFPTID